MQYADYDFYVNTYLGNTIDEKDFPRLSMRASAYIRGITRGLSEKVPDGDMDAVRMAACALAEIIKDEERLSAQSFSGEKPVSSETVGSHTISYSSPAMSGAEVEYIASRKKEAILLYLSEIPALASLFKVRSFKCIHHTL